MALNRIEKKAVMEEFVLMDVNLPKKET